MGTGLRHDTNPTSPCVTPTFNPIFDLLSHLSLDSIPHPFPSIVIQFHVLSCTDYVLQNSGQ